MRTRTIAIAAALLLAAGAMAFGTDANMGTWKLNEAKSKIPAMAPKNTTVVYEAAGDSIKVTVDGIDGQGKPSHNEWTGKFDGKDYPLVGDPQSNTRSYKKIDDHTIELTNKKDGKVTVKGRIVISADGKSRGVKLSGTDPQGNKVEYTTYYDKQ